MIIKSEEIHFGGERLMLTNHRAVYWEKPKTLILSDLHIGKTAHFRRSGIPISSKVLEKDLERLKLLINYFKVDKIVVVGDMFHAEINDDINLFSKWLKDFKNIEWILVKGNHDKWKNELYEQLSISVVNSCNFDPFIMIHDLKDLKEDTFYISGHTHPGVSIKGKGKQRIKLPCYQLSDNQLQLPAFSLFTGLNTRKTTVMCVQYAFTEQSIFKV